MASFNTKIDVLRQFMIDHFDQMHTAMLGVPRAYMAEHDPFYKLAHRLGKARKLFVVTKPTPNQLEAVSASELPIEQNMSADEFCVLMAIIYASQKMAKLTDLALFVCDESQHGETFYHEETDGMGDFHVMKSIACHSMPAQTGRIQ